MSEPVKFPCDEWEWLSTDKLTDVQPLRWPVGGFSKYRAIWRDNVMRAGHDMHSNTIVLLSMLAGYVNQDCGYAFPSIDRLAADMGWSKSPAERALKEGRAGGWLVWRKSDYQSSNDYRLAFSPRVVAAVRDHFELRIGGLDRATTSEVTWLDKLANHVRSDGPTTSEVTDQSRQIRGTILVRQPLEVTSEEGATDGKVEVSTRGSDNLPAGEVEASQAGADVAPTLPSPSPSSAPPARTVPALVDDDEDAPSAVPVLCDDPEPDPAAQAAFEREVFSWLGEGNVVRGRALAELIPVHMEKIHLAGSMISAGPMLKQARTAAISLEQQSQIKKSRVA